MRFWSGKVIKLEIFYQPPDTDKWEFDFTCAVCKLETPITMGSESSITIIGMCSTEFEANIRSKCPAVVLHLTNRRRLWLPGRLVAADRTI